MNLARMAKLEITEEKLLYRGCLAPDNPEHPKVVESPERTSPFKYDVHISQD
jgi:hypothetical protein